MEIATAVSTAANNPQQKGKNAHKRGKMNATKEVAATLTEPRVDMYIDACDQEGIWSLAKIVQVKKKSKSKRLPVKISYYGWGSEWDELVDFYDAKRIAQAGTHSVQLKCMVKLLDGHVSDSRYKYWPCIVNIRTPTMLGSKKEYEFAKESLRIEKRILIKPFGKEYLPHEISSAATNGGIWVNIEDVSPWKTIKEIEEKVSKKFFPAYQMALNSDCQLLPEKAFTVGTLIDKKFRERLVNPKMKSKDSGVIGQNFQSTLLQKESNFEVLTKAKKLSRLENLIQKKCINPTSSLDNTGLHDEYKLNNKARIEKLAEKKRTSSKSTPIYNEDSDRSANNSASKNLKEGHEATKTTRILKRKSSELIDFDDSMSNEDGIMIQSAQATATPPKHKKRKSRSHMSKYFENSDVNLSNNDDPRMMNGNEKKMKAIKEVNKEVRSMRADNSPPPAEDKDINNSKINRNDYTTERIARQHNPTKKPSTVKSIVTEQNQHFLVFKDADPPAKKMNVNNGNSEKLRKMVRSLKDRVSNRALIPEVDKNDIEKHQSLQEKLGSKESLGGEKSEGKLESNYFQQKQTVSGVVVSIGDGKNYGRKTPDPVVEEFVYRVGTQNNCGRENQCGRTSSSIVPTSPIKPKNNNNRREEPSTMSIQLKTSKINQPNVKTGKENKMKNTVPNEDLMNEAKQIQADRILLLSDSSPCTPNAIDIIGDKTHQEMGTGPKAGSKVHDSPSLSDESKVEVIAHEGSFQNQPDTSENNETVLMAVTKCRKTMDVDETINNSIFDSPDLTQKAATLNKIQSNDSCQHKDNQSTLKSGNIMEPEPGNFTDAKAPAMSHAEIFALLKAKRREARNNWNGRSRTLRKAVKKRRPPPLRILNR